MPNVTFFFNHKMTGTDYKYNKAWFEQKNLDAGRADEIEVPFDFLIGADGAHSAARFHIMKYTRMDYQQTYIDTLWCEFTISSKDIYPKDDAEAQYKISPHHLHIWPGKKFMFIAIPSLVCKHNYFLAVNLTLCRTVPSHVLFSCHHITSKLLKHPPRMSQISSTFTSQA